MIGLSRAVFSRARQGALEQVHGGARLFYAAGSAGYALFGRNELLILLQSALIQLAGDPGRSAKDAA